MRFLWVVVLVLGGCASVQVAPPPPSFPSTPVESRSVDQGSFGRALQRVVAEGFEVSATNPASGLLVAERTVIDQELTDRKAEGWIGGPAPPNYARRLTLTVVVGPTSATVSPKVVLCRQARANITCRPELLPELSPSEADLIERLLAALEAQPVPASGP